MIFKQMTSLGCLMLRCGLCVAEAYAAAVAGACEVFIAISDTLTCRCAVAITTCQLGCLKACWGFCGRTCCYMRTHCCLYFATALSAFPIQYACTFSPSAELSLLPPAKPSSIEVKGKRCSQTTIAKHVLPCEVLLCALWQGRQSLPEVCHEVFFSTLDIQCQGLLMHFMQLLTIQALYCMSLQGHNAVNAA